MKRFFLFILLFTLFFFAGCGGGSSKYDEYDDDTDPVTDKDSDSEKPDGDSGKPTDSDKDSETADEDSPDTDPAETEDSDSQAPADFWATCEGIIACTNGCIEEDSECFNECYSKGDTDNKLYYRRWRECFEDKCAEDKTAECSAEQCSEWDELCNVAEALEYELSFPAPYGHAEFSGDFSFILNNSFPTSETEIVMESFAKGNIASQPLPQSGSIISFVKKGTDPRDGDVLEVFQLPFDKTKQKPGNPVVILRIKTASATVGIHSIGFSDEDDARFIVGEIDEKYNISCHHAFGKGTFSIDQANIEIGSLGSLKFSAGTAELFSPANIPELGGDAQETLGVQACSLIM